MSKRANLNFLDIIFPVFCIGCEQEGPILCSRCFNSIPVILANHCTFCEKKTLFGNVCGSCERGHFLDGALACSPYSQNFILLLIHLWKYDSNANMTEFLGRFVLNGIEQMKRRARQKSANLLDRGITKKDIFDFADVPPILSEENIALQCIPLHPKKEKERGFNQARLLANYLARFNCNWHVVDFLERTKKTTAQATLDPNDRAVNMKDAFALKRKKTGSDPAAGIKSDKAASESGRFASESGRFTPSPSGLVAGASESGRFAPSPSGLVAGSSESDPAAGIKSDKAAIKGKHIVLVDDVITTGNTADNCAKLLKQAGAKSVWALTIAYGHPIKK